MREGELNWIKSLPKIKAIKEKIPDSLSEKGYYTLLAVLDCPYCGEKHYHGKLYEHKEIDLRPAGCNSGFRKLYREEHVNWFYILQKVDDN